MTRPKTYGEYADQTPNVTVDIRVRDREITDDAWRVLNAENELPQDIVEQFNMDSDKHTYMTTMTMRMSFSRQQLRKSQSQIIRLPCSRVL